MTCKKLLSLLCALMILLGVPVVHADTDGSFSTFANIPDHLYYQGGVIMRGHVKGADTSLPPLELAYVLTSMPYIIIGQPTTWEVTIFGGSQDYSCEVILAYQELSKDPFKESWSVPDWFDLEGSTFDYTFTKEGRYFWEFRVMDAGGEFFTFQTRIYETYTKANESDPTTTAGKANWVVSQVITPEMSTYARARALHDWLIYNANYDYTYTHRDAAGVLLHGTGVCDSYSRAYLMLCTIAGIECMYISGDGWTGDRWGAHGWNMIKLDDGKWYHVDCTWDDPGEGGHECHDYFCVDDETLAQDHRWNRPDDVYDNGYIPPESEGGEFESDTSESEGNYDFTFSTWEEFFAEFDKLVAAGHRREKTYGLYTGKLSSSEMYSAMGSYSSAKTQELYNQGLANGGGRGYSGKVFHYRVNWYEPGSYIRLSESKLRVSIGENALIIPTEYYPASNAFTWTSSNPAVATVTGSYSDENGLLATVTGVSAGTATITVTPPGGTAETVTVTVLPAYAPDFNLALDAASGDIALDWETIPGITEYQIIRVADGKETVLATTHDSKCELDDKLLPDDVIQQIYILALRKVGDTIVTSYKSEAISYGTFKPTFSSTLPGAMKAIDAEAFADCADLTSFDIPSGVTSIGDRAFAGCSGLTTIRIPASVTTIGAGAFSGCPLKYAVVEKNSYADLWLQEHVSGIQFIY